MRIEKFIATKPGLFNSRSVELNPGLTIIYGGNGSGKSLLSRALLDMAWGRACGAGCLKDGAWENFFLEVYLANTLHRYRFTHKSDRRFLAACMDNGGERALIGPDVRMTAETFREAIAQRAGDAEMAEMYGRIGPDLFHDLCFVPSPTETSRESAINYGQMRYIFFDDGCGFYPVYTEIREAIDTKDLANRVDNPLMNEILKMETHIRDLDKKIQIMDIQRSKEDKLRREIRQTEADIETHGNGLAETAGERGAIANIRGRLAEIRKVEERIALLREESAGVQSKSDAVKRKEAEIDAAFPQFRNFDETKKQNLRRLQETYRDIRDIRTDLDQSYYRLTARKKKFTRLALAISGTALVIAYIVGMINPLRLGREPRLISAAAILGAAFLAAGSLFLSTIIATGRKERAALQLRKTETETRLGEILRENGMDLYDFRLEAVYEFLLQYFEDYGQFTEKHLELYMLKESIKNAPEAALLEKEIRELELVIERLRAEAASEASALRSFQDGPLTEEAIDDYSAELDRKSAQMELERDRKLKYLQQLSTDTSPSSGFGEERARLEQEKAAGLKKLGKLKAHRRSIEYIGTLFEELLEQREKERLARLVRSTRDMFNTLTASQHVSEIDDDVIRGFITGQAKQDINPSVAHMLLLCMKTRLSAPLAEAGISLPLVIDDPFIFMDTKRGEVLTRLLAGASEGRQIIVFTQNSYYLDPERRIEL